MKLLLLIKVPASQVKLPRNPKLKSDCVQHPLIMFSNIFIKEKKIKLYF